jgi:hypothetical protein
MLSDLSCPLTYQSALRANRTKVSTARQLLHQFATCHQQVSLDRWLIFSVSHRWNQPSRGQLRPPQEIIPDRSTLVSRPSQPAQPPCGRLPFWPSASGNSSISLSRKAIERDTLRRLQDFFPNLLIEQNRLDNRRSCLQYTHAVGAFSIWPF